SRDRPRIRPGGVHRRARRPGRVRRDPRSPWSVGSTSPRRGRAAASDAAGGRAPEHRGIRGRGARSGAMKRPRAATLLGIILVVGAIVVLVAVSLTSAI